MVSWLVWTCYTMDLAATQTVNEERMVENLHISKGGTDGSVGENEEVNTYDMRFAKGSTIVIYGPSASGKTYRVADILRVKNQLIKNGHTIKSVIYCYAAWQPIYSILKKENTVTQWINYMPSNEQFIKLVKPQMKYGSICVIDDFMTSISKDLVEMVCVSARHYNCTLFILFQSLFPANPLARQISLNAKYLIISKNPRENFQVSYVLRQVVPDHYRSIVQAYYDATSRPYGYLLIDLTQQVSDDLRFRTNILPHEFPIVIYRPIKNDIRK